MSLHSELIKEQACADDLSKVIQMHNHEGRFDLAEQRTADLMRSIKRMQQLEKRIDERKRLDDISLDLARKGILTEVVSRYANQA